jgi:hypothetical protein
MASECMIISVIYTVVSNIAINIFPKQNFKGRTNEMLSGEFVCLSYKNVMTGE